MNATITKARIEALETEIGRMLKIGIEQAGEERFRMLVEEYNSLTED